MRSLRVGLWRRRSHGHLGQVFGINLLGQLFSSLTGLVARASYMPIQVVSPAEGSLAQAALEGSDTRGRIRQVRIWSLVIGIFEFFKCAYPNVRRDAFLDLSCLGTLESTDHRRAGVRKCRCSVHFCPKLLSYWTQLKGLASVCDEVLLEIRHAREPLATVRASKRPLP